MPQTLYEFKEVIKKAHLFYFFNDRSHHSRDSISNEEMATAYHHLLAGNSIVHAMREIGSRKNRDYAWNVKRVMEDGTPDKEFHDTINAPVPDEFTKEWDFFLDRIGKEEYSRYTSIQYAKVVRSRIRWFTELTDASINSVTVHGKFCAEYHAKNMTTDECAMAWIRDVGSKKGIKNKKPLELKCFENPPF